MARAERFYAGAPTYLNVLLEAGPDARSLDVVHFPQHFAPRRSCNHHLEPSAS